jgi:uncharacterized protein YqgV (UPF0045/DUF77 family)/uncharacterized membrane protein YuzA (DUF378 family)
MDEDKNIENINPKDFNEINVLMNQLNSIETNIPSFNDDSIKEVTKIAEYMFKSQEKKMEYMLKIEEKRYELSLKELESNKEIRLKEISNNNINGYNSRMFVVSIILSILFFIIALTAIVGVNNFQIVKDVLGILVPLLLALTTGLAGIYYGKYKEKTKNE